jgi:hypothetical protein
MSATFAGIAAAQTLSSVALLPILSAAATFVGTLAMAQDVARARAAPRMRKTVDDNRVGTAVFEDSVLRLQRIGELVRPRTDLVSVVALPAADERSTIVIEWKSGERWVVRGVVRSVASRAVEHAGFGANRASRTTRLHSFSTIRSSGASGFRSIWVAPAAAAVAMAASACVALAIGSSRFVSTGLPWVAWWLAQFFTAWTPGKACAVDVGRDALCIRDWFRAERVPLSMIALVVSTDTGLRIRLSDGTSRVLDVVPANSSDESRAAIDALFDRIAEVRALAAASTSTPHAALARGARDVAAWSASLRDLARNDADDYRAIDVSRDDLARAMDDGTVPPRIRIAAAAALAMNDAVSRQRIVDAGNASIDPDVRAAMADIADGRVERALARVRDRDVT